MGLWSNHDAVEVDMGGKAYKTATNRKALIFSEIEELRRRGLNQTEIADMHGVSRQAVSWHKTTYGGQKSTRQIVNEAWPWETTHLHGKAAPYKRLRDHAEYMATDGRGMSEDKLKRLRTFYRKLRNENLVVEFDPDLPPEPGVSPHGGFAYRQRMVQDGDLLIRVNDHTQITDDGREIWCFPPADP